MPCPVASAFELSDPGAVVQWHQQYSERNQQQGNKHYQVFEYWCNQACEQHGGWRLPSLLGIKDAYPERNFGRAVNG